MDILGDYNEICVIVEQGVDHISGWWNNVFIQLLKVFQLFCATNISDVDSKV